MATRVVGVGGAPGARRVPVQARSRRRVEAILTAAADALALLPVEQLTVGDIAATAGVPAASVYAYFAHKESVLVALAERELVAVDERVQERTDLTVGTTVAEFLDCLVRATADELRARPAVAAIVVHGRTNAELHHFVEGRVDRLAASLCDRLHELHLTTRHLTAAQSRLVAQVVDQTVVHLVTGAADDDGVLAHETVVMLTRYLDPAADLAG